MAASVSFTLITSSRGPSAGAGGDRVHGLRERVVVDALVGEAYPLGRLTVEHLSEKHGRCRDLRTDDAPQHPRVSPAWVQADLDEAGVELRPLRCDP